MLGYWCCYLYQRVYTLHQDKKKNNPHPESRPGPTRSTECPKPNLWSHPLPADDPAELCDQDRPKMPEPSPGLSVGTVKLEELRLDIPTAALAVRPVALLERYGGPGRLKPGWRAGLGVMTRHVSRHIANAGRCES